VYETGVIGDRCAAPFLPEGEGGTDMVIDMGVMDSVRGVCVTEDEVEAGETFRSYGFGPDATEVRLRSSSPEVDASRFLVARRRPLVAGGAPATAAGAEGGTGLEGMMSDFGISAAEAGSMAAALPDVLWSSVIMIGGVDPEATTLPR
jgi:hypothetical protein